MARLYAGGFSISSTFPLPLGRACFGHCVGPFAIARGSVYVPTEMKSSITNSRSADAPGKQAGGGEDRAGNRFDPYPWLLAVVVLVSRVLITGPIYFIDGPETSTRRSREPTLFNRQATGFLIAPSLSFPTLNGASFF